MIVLVFAWCWLRLSATKRKCENEIEKQTLMLPRAAKTKNAKQRQYHPLVLNMSHDRRSPNECIDRFTDIATVNRHTIESEITIICKKLNIIHSICCCY